MANKRGTKKCDVGNGKRRSSQRHMTAREAREQSGNSRVTRCRRHQGEVVEETIRGGGEQRVMRGRELENKKSQGNSSGEGERPSTETHVHRLHDQTGEQLIH